MVLQEFVHLDNKKQIKALEKLNNKRLKNPNIHDDANGPDCKCDWEGDCEDLCRDSMK